MENVADQGHRAQLARLQARGELLSAIFADRQWDAGREDVLELFDVALAMLVLNEEKSQRGAKPAEVAGDMRETSSRVSR